MALINPEFESKDEVSVDFSAFTSDDAATMSGDITAPKKRGRPAKKKMGDGATIVTSDGTEVVEPLAMWQSNQPYLETYSDSRSMLYGAIVELDAVAKDVKEELSNVKDSKTLRNKYGLVNDLANTAANIIGQKIRAVQEIDSIVTKSHELDMRRFKDLKTSMAAEAQNSDQRIFDMYNAFINTPVGTYNPTQFPTMQEITMGGPDTGIVSMDITNNAPVAVNDPSYNAYKQRETPEQRMMIMQKNNPNIKTVVVYNQENQTKRFEVRDMTTGQIVPGMATPAEFLLADTTINLANGVARNANIDTVYPLVIEGNATSILNY